METADKSEEELRTNSGTPLEVSHRVTTVMYFPEDTDAVTDDPRKMKKNFQFPLHAIFRNQETNEIIHPTNGNVQFVISPEFVRSHSLPAIPALANIKPKSISGDDDFNVEAIRWGTEPKLLVFDQSTKAALGHGIDSLLNITQNVSPKPIVKKQQDLHIVLPRNKDGTLNKSFKVTSVNFGILKMPVSIKGLQSLHPGVYINKEIIDVGCILAIMACKNNANISYMTTTGWACAFVHHEDVYSDFKRQTLFTILTNRQPDVSSIKYLVWPITRENHWTVCIVYRPFISEERVKEFTDKINTSLPKKKFKLATDLYQQWLATEGPEFFYFDSRFAYLKSVATNYEEFKLDTCMYIYRCLFELHSEDWARRGNDTLSIVAKGISTSVQTDLRPTNVDVPQQLYGSDSDSGIFVIAYVKLFFKLIQDMEIAHDTVVTFDWNKIFHHDENIAFYRVKLYNYIRYKTACESVDIFKQLFDEDPDDRLAFLNLLQS